MEVVKIQQGTSEWDEHRRNHFNASDAPAMMGVSPYMSRDELLKIMATGITPDVSPAKQALFDKGHAAEAAIRPYVEETIGQELYPVVGTIKFDGLKLSASFDGLTMTNSIVFEHKLYNDKLAKYVRKGDIEPMYAFQLEQQLLVSGADIAYFVVSDGTPDNFIKVAYKSDPYLLKAMIAGWKQFKKDLEAYEAQVEAVPAKTTSIMELPALDIQIHGEVKSSNLSVYEEKALSFIDSINTDLQTDDDFAQAELTVKFCANSEKKLELVKEQALAQTADIDTLFKTIDRIKEDMSRKRLALDKLVKQRKEAIRFEIKNEAESALMDHLATLSKGLGHDMLPAVNVDFVGVMKGLKTVSSLRNAVNTELARVKIEINDIAEKIRGNISYLDAFVGNDYMFLFNDLRTIVNKDADDFEAIVKLRVSEHKQAEEKKLEQERERIRKEEQENTAKYQRTDPISVEPNETPSISIPIQPQKEELDSAKTRNLVTSHLTEYERGYVDGLIAYAYLDNGVQYVGCAAIPLDAAVDDFLNRKQ